MRFTIRVYLENEWGYRLHHAERYDKAVVAAHDAIEKTKLCEHPVHKVEIIDEWGEYPNVMIRSSRVK